MKRLIVLVLALALAGCSTFSNAHYHIVCPEVGTTAMMVGGNTAGQQILTLALAVGGAAAKGAGFADTAPPNNTPPAKQSTLDYDELAWFGADGASCTNLPPPQPAPPTTTINNNQGGTLNMTAPPR